MTIFDTIILGIIEGITEFLPISSTGHLIVASEFLGIEQNSINKAFEVIIQFAAILAVILTYPSKFTLSHIDLWTKVMIAFFPITLLRIDSTGAYRSSDDDDDHHHYKVCYPLFSFSLPGLSLSLFLHSSALPITFLPSLPLPFSNSI